ncbi:IPExxxVDY family protein [Capnocytophaga sp.]|uniref:IPExxxVDY family protein n=1 Tax=Capnocytophaga sp. TaxID=44737 RepID=UPI0026DC9D2E|nr:IPExxxVDY family protein [Capnocytophaga sp.]MDO5104610.1 IPExxxVDY family protein [Capnocytophaga sp.]
MIVHKLSDYFFDDDFTLIAIHTTLEDYRLAYFLNKVLNLRFSRSYNRCDLKNIENGKGFSYFCWNDKASKIAWHCFANKLVFEQKTPQTSLFSQMTLVHYLVDSKKKVDFFLKMDGQGTLKTQEVIEKIVTIPNVTAAYTINTDTLSSKHKLIFQEC